MSGRKWIKPLPRDLRCLFSILCLEPELSLESFNATFVVHIIAGGLVPEIFGFFGTAAFEPKYFVDQHILDKLHFWKRDDSCRVGL